MSLPQIIAFTGLAGSGKSYAAKWFKLRTGYHYTEFSFSSTIKRIACEIGWDGKKDKNGRKLLQEIGSAGRRYSKDTWLRFMPKNTPLIIDDVRFINEAKAIYELDGIVIRINRPGLVPMKHESERQQSRIKVDYGIANDGKLEELLEYIYQRMI
jgi:hypothetical protein